MNYPYYKIYKVVAGGFEKLTAFDIKFKYFSFEEAKNALKLRKEMIEWKYGSDSKFLHPQLVIQEYTSSYEARIVWIGSCKSVSNEKIK